MTKEIRFEKADWRLFFICLVAGTFVFFAKIVNELPNPDAIWQGMAYKAGWGWEGGLGRYMIGLLQKARSSVINVEFISLTCMLLLALVCVFVNKVLDITNQKVQLMIASLIILSPSVGSTLTYYYCSDMYFLSYVLAIVSVLFVVRNQSIKGMLACAVGLCISAAIYQAYLGVTITLCFIYLLYQLVDARYSIKDIGRLAGRLALSGGAGIILYLISNSWVQREFGIQAVADRGFATMGRLSLLELPKLIQSAYVSFFEYFFGESLLNNTWGGKRLEINYLFAIVAVGVLILILCFSKVAWYRKLLIVLAVICLPIPIMSIVVMAPQVSIYDSTGVLMLPTMNYVYITFLVMFYKHKDLLKANLQKLVKVFLCGSSLLVCYMLLVLELSGQAYMKHHMDKTQAVALMMMSEIEEVVEQSANYRICIVGTMENGNYPEIYEPLRNGIRWTTAYHKTMWTSFSGSQNGWSSYLSHYLGKQYRICSQADYDRVLASAEYAQMQNFPDERSVIVIDDLVVIKLSDA